MNKRYLQLYLKTNKKVYPFATVKELCKAFGKDKIGVGVGAIYNAFNKKGHFFENDKCRIEFKETITSEWK